MHLIIIVINVHKKKTISQYITLEAACLFPSRRLFQNFTCSNVHGGPDHSQRHLITNPYWVNSTQTYHHFINNERHWVFFSLYKKKSISFCCLFGEKKPWSFFSLLFHASAPTDTSLLQMIYLLLWRPLWNASL